MKCRERRDMQIRPVGNGVIGADEITWSIHPSAPGHHRYAVNGSYRALRDGSLFYTFPRHFMPGYHRISLRDSKPRWAFGISLRGSTVLYLRASASICGSSFLFLSLRIRSRPFAVLITLLQLIVMRFSAY
jgi:hypothetical protein